MKETESNITETNELPDSWWHRVYVGVIAATIVVISALWTFSKYFQ